MSDGADPRRRAGVLLAALRSLRLASAILMAAPATAGWLWNTGDAWPRRIPEALGVLLGACLLTGSTFLWNDRADVLRGVAQQHRFAHVRRLATIAGVAPVLLWLGNAGTVLAVLVWGGVRPASALLGACVALTGWLYSHPTLFAKGHPRAAMLLHFLGNAAGSTAGALGATNRWTTALVWGGCNGLLFSAAHLVHTVGDRVIDQRAGLRTFATLRSAVGTETFAFGFLLATLAIVAAAGVPVAGARGAGLIVWGAFSLVGVVVVRVLVRDRADGWTVFQTWCRAAVAFGAVAGVVCALAVPA